MEMRKSRVRDLTLGKELTHTAALSAFTRKESTPSDQARMGPLITRYLCVGIGMGKGDFWVIKSTPAMCIHLPGHSDRKCIAESRN